MKKIAKWVVIGWTIFCLLGVIAGMANVGSKVNNTRMNEAEKTGAAIGTGCGLGIWFGAWCFIAIPGTVVFLVSGEKKDS